MVRMIVPQLARLQARTRVRALLLASSAIAALMAIAPVAMATESEAQTKVKTIAETVNTEVIAVFLIVVGAIGTAFAIIVAVVLAFRKLHSLIK